MAACPSSTRTCGCASRWPADRATSAPASTTSSTTSWACRSSTRPSPPTDIEGAIRGVRALGIRGCSVSMPFKEAVIPLVDSMEPSATAIDSVNTIVNDDGVLTASNTDYEAVARAARRPRGRPGELGPGSRLGWDGQGGGGGHPRCRVRGPDRPGPQREHRSGARRALRRAVGGRASPTPRRRPPRERHPARHGGPRRRPARLRPRRIAARASRSTSSPSPSETPFVAAARAAGVPVITGAEVIALQAARQFERYTGVTPTARPGGQGLGVLPPVATPRPGGALAAPPTVTDVTEDRVDVARPGGERRRLVTRGTTCRDPRSSGASAHLPPPSPRSSSSSAMRRRHRPNRFRSPTTWPPRCRTSSSPTRRRPARTAGRASPRPPTRARWSW